MFMPPGMRLLSAAALPISSACAKRVLSHTIFSCWRMVYVVELVLLFRGLWRGITQPNPPLRQSRSSIRRPALFRKRHRYWILQLHRALSRLVFSISAYISINQFIDRRAAGHQQCQNRTMSSIHKNNNTSSSIQSIYAGNMKQCQSVKLVLHKIYFTKKCQQCRLLF